MTAPALSHLREMQVEWGHCDPAGIVFHPRYLEMFDACAALLFQQASGMTKAAMLAHYQAAGIPVVQAGAKFTTPCGYGDMIRIETRMETVRRSSFDLRHLLFKEGELAVEGWSTRVWVGRDATDPKRLRSLPIPADLVAAFAVPG